MKTLTLIKKTINESIMLANCVETDAFAVLATDLRVNDVSSTLLNASTVSPEVIDERACSLLLMSITPKATRRRLGQILISSSDPAR